MFLCAAPIALAIAMAPCGQYLMQRISLPDEVAWPEGIAYDPAGDALFVAGTKSGQIARIDLKTRSAKLIGSGIPELGGAFPGVLGMKLDGKRRLWMAGGRTGKILVADSRTGKLIGTAFTQEGSFPNDLAIANGAAYFTDTLKPMLWSVRVGGKVPAKATPLLSYEGTPLQYAAGPNLNGIVATPDGRALIVVQMNKGLLFRIDIAAKKVAQIDLKGEDIAGADGLVLKGDLLFAVRQAAGEIVTIRLDPGLGSGTIVKRTSPVSLRSPATAALAGGALWVVNTQFNRHGSNDPELPFFVSHVPLKDLGID